MNIAVLPDTTSLIRHHHPLPNFQRQSNKKGFIMINNNSPLETLAAFAIVFVVGVLVRAGFGTYISKLKKEVAKD